MPVCNPALLPSACPGTAVFLLAPGTAAFLLALDTPAFLRVPGTAAFLLTQSSHHHRFDSMHAVFGFVKYY